MSAGSVPPADAAQHASGWAGLGGTLTSKLAVARQADGRVVAFALGTGGELFRIAQVPGGWSEWVTMGGGFASHPVVATNGDGRLEVFVRGNDRAIYHVAQDRPSSDTWSQWASLRGELDSDVTIGVNDDGRIELFARGADGVLQTNRQAQAGGCWSGWASRDVAVMLR